jgi:hypothetical protein
MYVTDRTHPAGVKTDCVSKVPPERAESREANQKSRFAGSALGFWAVQGARKIKGEGWSGSDCCTSALIDARTSWRGNLEGPAVRRRAAAERVSSLSTGPGPICGIQFWKPPMAITIPTGRHLSVIPITNVRSVSLPINMGVPILPRLCRGWTPQCTLRQLQITLDAGIAPACLGAPYPHPR